MTGPWGTLAQTQVYLAASALFWPYLREQVGRWLRPVRHTENCCVVAACQYSSVGQSGDITYLGSCRIGKGMR